MTEADDRPPRRVRLEVLGLEVVGVVLALVGIYQSTGVWETVSAAGVVLIAAGQILDRRSGSGGWPRSFPRWPGPAP